jgi:hypothetical protein
MGHQPIVMNLVGEKIINAIGKWIISSSYDNISFNPIPRVMKIKYVFIEIAIGSLIFKFLDSSCWVRIGSSF